MLNNVYEYEDETAKTSIKTINDWFDENAVAMVDNKSIDLGRDIEERLMSVHQKINNILDNGELTEEEAKEAAAYVDETQNRLGAILSGRKE